MINYNRCSTAEQKNNIQEGVLKKEVKSQEQKTKDLEEVRATLFLLVPAADSLCKQFGARSGVTKCQTVWIQIRPDKMSKSLYPDQA